MTVAVVDPFTIFSLQQPFSVSLKRTWYLVTFPVCPALAGGSHFSATQGLCVSTDAVRFWTGSGVRAVEYVNTSNFVLHLKFYTCNSYILLKSAHDYIVISIDTVHGKAMLHSLLTCQSTHRQLPTWNLVSQWMKMFMRSDVEGQQHQPHSYWMNYPVLWRPARLLIYKTGVRDFW